jgi:peptide deformylase
MAVRRRCKRMAVLPIIELPDARLREVSAPVEIFDRAR